MTMQLPRAGREFARWTIATDQPISGIEARIVGANQWHPCDYDPEAGIGRLLVYGPDCNETDEGVLIAATCCLELRVTDSPEIVIRDGGWITLTQL